MVEKNIVNQERQITVSDRGESIQGAYNVIENQNTEMQQEIFSYLRLFPDLTFKKGHSTLIMPVSLIEAELENVLPKSPEHDINWDARSQAKAILEKLGRAGGNVSIGSITYSPFQVDIRLDEQNTEEIQGRFVRRYYSFVIEDSRNPDLPISIFIQPKSDDWEIQDNFNRSQPEI